MHDYNKLGFKCGIEIHQQINGLKLFCNCPTLNSDKEPNIKFERRLRASAGETGKIDAAAKHEMEKEKKFIYVSNSEDTCLVEFDEEPPHPINEKALSVILQVAKLLNAEIVDEIQVMRKTVVDGSNVSGFQRTALVATDGCIETSMGKVSIPTICLEEEAAQKLKDDKDSATYKLDRLGIPLIEIATDADIKSPEHAKEVAAYLGMVLRSTGNCKRGIGTIRQDVNISIKGGARTEIKGFQDLRSIVKVSENEVARQLELIKAGKKIKEEVRKAEPDFTTSFLRPMPGADRMYPETDVPPINITKEMISKIKIPELISDKLEGLEKKYDISKEKIKAIIKLDKLPIFEKLIDKNKKIKTAYVVDTLLSYSSEILKKNKEADIYKIKDEDLENVFGTLNDGKIAKGSVIEILADIAAGKGLDFSKYELADINLEEEIKKIVSEKPGLSVGGYMGLVMGKFKGQVNGKEVMDILKKIVK